MPPGENAVRNLTKIPPLWQAFFLDFTRFASCKIKCDIGKLPKQSLMVPELP